MMNRLFRLNPLLIKSFSTSLKPKKDYYAILGVSKSSNIDDIKKAYRTLAKLYHPDVTTSNSKIPDVKSHEKFREIAEAYAVLSNIHSKVKYDETYETKPESVYNSTKMKNMDEARKERDESGNIKPENYDKGSYADFRLEKLKEWRKEFNFDNLGNFKGGVPRPYKGYARGNSHKSPLTPYEGYLHNDDYADSPNIKGVQSFDRIQHQAFQNIKREENLRFKPYFNIQEVEMDHQYEQTSENRFLMVFPLTILFVYLSYLGLNRLKKDKERINLNNFVENLNVDQYQMLGPIMILAEEFKFNKKYLERREYHTWLDNDFRTFK